jgi:hypothetical protein
MLQDQPSLRMFLLHATPQALTTLQDNIPQSALCSVHFAGQAAQTSCHEVQHTQDQMGMHSVWWKQQ